MHSILVVEVRASKGVNMYSGSSSLHAVCFFKNKYLKLAAKKWALDGFVFTLVWCSIGVTDVEVTLLIVPIPN